MFIKRFIYLFINLLLAEVRIHIHILVYWFYSHKQANAIFRFVMLSAKASGQRAILAVTKEA